MPVDPGIRSRAPSRNRATGLERNHLGSTLATYDTIERDAMNLRTLGTDLAVSEIGLGCMSLTGAYGNSGGPSREDSIALIRRAVDLGVTFFDTAEV